MASSDMTALMLQMMKQMQEQHHAVDERQRQFMATILERRADQTPAAIRPTIRKSPTIKIDLKEFSGQPEDWTTWSKVHRAHLSALGCVWDTRFSLLDWVRVAGLSCTQGVWYTYD